MRLAIIPARGGSKRIPRKNIRLFHGEPLIAYSIKAAQQSGCFERIIVSTDDAEIANVAIKCGAEVPFIRPEHLSGDFTPTLNVIQHAIGFLAEQGTMPTEVCCIYATAPLIHSQDIADGYEKLKSGECEYVFAATRFAYPIQRGFFVDEQQGVQMFQPECFDSRSQDLTEALHDAGQFYWGRSQAFLDGKNMFSTHSRLVILPRVRVQDIDTLEDWQQAELLYSMLQQQQEFA